MTSCSRAGRREAFLTFGRDLSTFAALMPELLSICIPTFNRASYLRDLLDTLIPELEQAPEAAGLVRLYISDNASPDSTPQVIETFSGRWPIIHNRNARNIGGDYNFAQMIDRATGDYFWLLGDDELMAGGFLTPLLERLKPKRDHLLILDGLGTTRAANLNPKNPATFPDYAALVAHYSRLDPWQLVEHTLISSLIIKRDVFDREANRKILLTKDRNYAHMHGLAEGLIQNPGPVHFHQVPTIHVREQRPPTEGVTYLKYRYLWGRYYKWLGRKFGHAELTAYARVQFTWRTWIRLQHERLKYALGWPRES